MLENKLPKRKHPRLENYDYSSAGAYFVTICTQGRRCLLSSVVGWGLAPAETRYTAYGQIAREQLLLLEERYPTLKVDKYVIMPNHIHAILTLREAAGASPRPSLTDIVRTRFAGHLFTPDFISFFAGRQPGGITQFRLTQKSAPAKSKISESV